MGVRIPSTATFSGLGLLSQAPAGSSAGKFLQILASVSEEEAPRGGLTDSRSDADTESAPANHAASARDKTTLLFNSDDEPIRGGKDHPAADLQKLPSEHRAEPNLFSDGSGSRTISGSRVSVNGDSGHNSSNWTGGHYRAEASGFRSYVLPTALTSIAGISIPNTLAFVSRREIHIDTSASSNATMVAGVNAASRPASRQDGVSAAIVPGKANSAGASAAAPADQSKESTEQKPGSPMNGAWAKREFSEPAMKESVRATASVSGAPTSSAIANAIPLSRTLARATPSGNADLWMSGDSSKRESSRNDMGSDGAEAFVDASAGTHVATRQQAMPVPSSFGVASDGRAESRLVEQWQSPVQARPGVLESGQLPAGAFLAIASGEGQRATHDDPSLPTELQTPGSSIPATSLQKGVSAVDDLSPMNVDDSTAQSFEIASVDSNGKPGGHEMGALVSSPATISVSAAPSPAPASPSAHSSQQPIVSASDKEAFLDVLANTRAAMQPDRISVRASSPVAVSSSSPHLSVESGSLSDRFEPAPVSAPSPEGQLSLNALVDAGALEISNAPSVGAPEATTALDVPSQPHSQTSSFDQSAQPSTSSGSTQNSSAEEPVELFVEARETSSTAYQQQQDPSPFANENAIARNAAGLLPVDPSEAQPHQAPSVLKDGTDIGDLSSKASPRIVSADAAPITKEVVLRQIVSRPVPDIATPQQTALQPKLASQAAPQIVSADRVTSIPFHANTTPDSQPVIAAAAPEATLTLPIDLPMTSAPANSETVDQTASNSVEKAPSGANGSKNSAPAAAADAATSRTSDANGSGDPLQPAAQNIPQPSQNAHADPSHNADSAIGATGSTAPQTQVQPQAVPLQTAPEAGTTHRAPDAPGVAARAGEQQSVPPSMHPGSGEVAAPSGINAAKLMQTMNQSEMHVGMRSSEFGDISIRTSIAEQEMVTRISLDHGELSQAISAHVSAMQAKLGEDLGLNASIQVHNLGSSPSGEFGQSSPGEQRSLHHSVQTAGVPSSPEEEAGTSMAATAIAGNPGRLDIRA